MPRSATCSPTRWAPCSAPESPPISARSSCLTGDRRDAFSLARLAAWLVVLAVSAIGMMPWLPAGAIRNDCTKSVGKPDVFTGTVQSVSLNGVPLPCDADVPESQRLRNELGQGEAELDVTTRVEQPPERAGTDPRRAGAPWLRAHAGSAPSRRRVQSAHREQPSRLLLADSSAGLRLSRGARRAGEGPGRRARPPALALVGVRRPAASGGRCPEPLARVDGHLPVGHSRRAAASGWSPRCGSVCFCCRSGTGQGSPDYPLGRWAACSPPSLRGSACCRR